MKKKVFSINGAEASGYPRAKKMYSNVDPIPFTKVNSKWIIDLIIKLKTINLLEDNIGEKLDDLRYHSNF